MRASCRTRRRSGWRVRGCKSSGKRWEAKSHLAMHVKMWCDGVSRPLFLSTVRQKAKNYPGTDVPVRLVALDVVSWSEPGVSSCGDAGPDADMQEQGNGGRAINPRP